MKRLTVRDVLHILLALTVGFIITMILMWRHFYYQCWVGIPLERQLGFSVGSPFTEDPGYFLGREVSSVVSVAPHGSARAAGLREGDVFVDYCQRDRGSTGFFRDLASARGREFCFSVVRIEAPGPLESRARRNICLQVP